MGSVDLVRLILWAFCAFLVERLVEGFVKVFPFLDKRKVLGCSVNLLLAFVFSVVVAYGAGFNLFDMFSIPFLWPMLGPMAAAIIMAGGSSGVHRIIKRWFRYQNDVKSPEAAFGSSTTTLHEEPEVATETEKTLDAVKASTTAPLD